MKAAFLFVLLMFAACASSQSWDSGAYQYNGGSGSPTAFVSPSSISFGNQVVNTTSAAMNVTVTNTGSASLVFSGSKYALTTGTQFAIGPGNTCHITYSDSLPQGDSCVIPITFTPTTLGMPQIQNIHYVSYLCCPKDHS